MKTLTKATLVCLYDMPEKIKSPVQAKELSPEQANIQTFLEIQQLLKKNGTYIHMKHISNQGLPTNWFYESKPVGTTETHPFFNIDGSSNWIRRFSGTRKTTIREKTKQEEMDTKNWTTPTNEVVNMEPTILIIREWNKFRVLTHDPNLGYWWSKKPDKSDDLEYMLAHGKLVSADDVKKRVWETTEVQLSPVEMQKLLWNIKTTLEWEINKGVTRERAKMDTLKAEMNALKARILE